MRHLKLQVYPTILLSHTNILIPVCLSVLPIYNYSTSKFIQVHTHTHTHTHTEDWFLSGVTKKLEMLHHTQKLYLCSWGPPETRKLSEVPRRWQIQTLVTGIRCSRSTFLTNQQMDQALNQRYSPRFRCCSDYLAHWLLAPWWRGRLVK